MAESTESGPTMNNGRGYRYQPEAPCMSTRVTDEAVLFVGCLPFDTSYMYLMVWYGTLCAAGQGPSIQIMR